MAASRQDISFAEDTFKQHFALKMARLRKQLDFLVENIDGTEPASPVPLGTVELLRINRNNPFLGDIDSDNKRSNGTFGDLSWMPTPGIPVANADPQTGELTTALHGLTYAEYDRLRGFCKKEGAILGASFHSLCGRLGVPQPYGSSQIRKLGFSARDLAHNFLLQFPAFCEPAQVSSSHAEAFLEFVFSHHLMGQAFHGPPTNNPRGQRPTVHPTPETVGSEEAIVASVEGQGEHFLPQMEEIPSIGNKKPRKGNRSTLKEPFFDYHLHEQRLIWQREAWHSTLSDDFILAARGDRRKMQFLHCEREAALSKQRERNTADELQDFEPDRCHRFPEAGGHVHSRQTSSEVAIEEAKSSHRPSKDAAETIATTQTKGKPLEDGFQKATGNPSRERTAKEKGNHQWRPMPYDDREHEAERFRALADWAKEVDEPLPPVLPPQKKRRRKRTAW